MTREGRRSRYLVWLALSLPCVVLVLGYLSGRLFYGEVVHASGEWSVRFLLLAMAATPLNLMFPGRAFPRWLLSNRRYFGVASFAYAFAHTAVYLDKTGSVAEILQEAVEPEYLTAWVATGVFLALAVTSNDASVRVLKRGWKSLHRLVYPAALLSFAHWLLVAFDPVAAVLHLVVLLALEAYRVVRVARLRRGSA